MDSGNAHPVRIRTSHLVCFFVLLATLGVADAMPCRAALGTAQVQSSTLQAAHLPQSLAHEHAAAEAGPALAPAARAFPVWQAALPPARTAALQAHTTRA